MSKKFQATRLPFSPSPRLWRWRSSSRRWQQVRLVLDHGGRDGHRPRAPFPASPPICHAPSEPARHNDCSGSIA